MNVMGRPPKRMIAVLKILLETQLPPLKTREILARFPYKLNDPSNLSVTLHVMRKRGWLWYSANGWGLTEHGAKAYKELVSREKARTADEKTKGEVLWIRCPGCTRALRVPEDHRRKMYCECGSKFMFLRSDKLWAEKIKGVQQPTTRIVTMHKLTDNFKGVLA